MSNAADQHHLLYEGGRDLSWLKEYTIQLIAAALICAVVFTVFDKKDLSSGIVRLICGLLMLISVISPWVKLKLGQMDDWSDAFRHAASDAVQAGQNASYQAMSERIIARTQAYILDKAGALGVSPEVTVFVESVEGIPVPSAVRIYGNFSPFVRNRLQSILENELGIPTEAQTWIQ